MKILDFFNQRIRRLNIFDVKLAQGAAIFLALVIVKLIPEILTIDIWWFIALTIFCAVRPVYVFFLKN